MIPFNVPPYIGKEIEYIEEAINNQRICGDGYFTKKCNHWMERRFNANKIMLTTSGSTALDMAAFLCSIEEGDEIILPSYSFPSTANSFVLAGAKLVFVDIRPDTMNIDEKKIEPAITKKTKAIVPVHYAGVACEMDYIIKLSEYYHLMVVEDAAQGVMSSYKGKALGTIGDFGCYSFHETKNYSMGEGGAIAINNSKYNEKAEILRDKGTNRSQFFRGQVDKYTWVDFGDSYLQSDLNAAFLWAQLEVADLINDNRLDNWCKYYNAFKEFEDKGIVELPVIPNGCTHNAHMFYLKFKDLRTRTAYINHMKENGISCTFHFVPLHSAPAGRKFGRFVGEDLYTTKESERIVRLPLYYGLSDKDIQLVIENSYEFIKKM